MLFGRPKGQLALVKWITATWKFMRVVAADHPH
jgi:hypothetical protein